MALPNVVFGSSGAQFQTSTDKRAPFGTAMYLADGRKFRYHKASTSNIATAALSQTTLPDANFDELVVPTARAVGDTTITLTTGSTAAAKDLLAEGYLTVSDDTGEGYIYTIQSNAAASTTATLTINLNEPLQVAWTTSTTCDIFVNPWATTIVHPSPATAMLLGVTPRIATASTYGWLQIGGLAAVTTEGTVVINERVIDSASADGAVAPTASTAAGEEYYVGVVYEVAVTTEQSTVKLMMD